MLERVSDSRKSLDNALCVCNGTVLVLGNVEVHTKEGREREDVMYVSNQAIPMD